MTSAHGPEPTERVAVAVMRHRWEAATFLHWSYPVATVQEHLPPGLSVEPRKGRAWVGLVLFRMHVEKRAEVTGLLSESDYQAALR